MKKFSYEITIEARQEAEAEAKMRAIAVLANGLSVEELTRLAHILKHDPIKTALAKKYLKI